MAGKINMSKVIEKILFWVILSAAGTAFAAQDSVEWTTLGNDHGNTRFTTSEEITPTNFSDLEVVWEWDGASLGAASGRSTPSYIDGTRIPSPDLADT